MDKWIRGCEGVWLGLRDVGEGILVEEVEAVVRFVLVTTKMKGRVRHQGSSLSAVVTHTFLKRNEKIQFSR